MKTLLCFLLLVLGIGASASACDGFNSFSQFSFGGHRQQVVFAQPSFGFAQPVFSVHQFNHGRNAFVFGGRQAVVFGGHRQQVVVQRNSLFGNRQRIVIRNR